MIHVETKSLPAQLQRITSKKEVRIRVQTDHTIPFDDGTWSGGSRTTHSALDLLTGREVGISDTFNPPWAAERQDKRIPLRPGFALVEHSVFQGKVMPPTLYIHPDNAAALLPAPGPTLSDDESKVLDVTCGYKSFARSDELRRKGLTDDRIALAKRSLQAMGYLNAQGAVTTAGKNARPQR